MAKNGGNNLSFEQSLSELEKISEQLEGENVSLDKAIELFERGIELSKNCSEKLKTAKQKIETLTAAGSETDD